MKRILAIIFISLILVIGALFIFREWLRRGEFISRNNVTFQGHGRIKITISSPVNSISVEIDDERDLYTALGFSQALMSGDRMEFLRLCALGDLSEHLGQHYEPFDFYMKSWKFEKLADYTLDSLDIITCRKVQAFTDGINRRYEIFPPPSGCLWAGIEPVPWKTEHVVALWHLLRWSQTENWPLYFFIRYLDIYYGRHVKEQFETAQGGKIHDQINIGHVRKFMELFETDRKFRVFTGLRPVLDEHLLSPRLIYAYSGSQNEDWIRIDVKHSEMIKSYVMHVGLPLFFSVNHKGVYPVAMRMVPLYPIDPDGEKKMDIVPSSIDIYENIKYFDFSIRAALFDINGNIFKALMNKDSVENQHVKNFSYGIFQQSKHAPNTPVYIQSRNESDVNREIIKVIKEKRGVANLPDDYDPLLLSIFRVRLVNYIYRDDLTVLHPDMAEWPFIFQSIFLRHLQIIFKNPYSAWWDKKETQDITENMYDIINEVFEELYYLFDNISHQNIISDIRAVEHPGHPLSRFHLFTGSWQYYSKDLTAPLLIKSQDDQYYYERFYFTP